jgi:hypothetical protein
MLCGRPRPGGLIELGGDRKHDLWSPPHLNAFQLRQPLASRSCSGEANGQMAGQKATSGAPSRLIEDLEVIANLLSRSPLQDCGSTQNSGSSVNFRPSERHAYGSGYRLNDDIQRS